VIKPYKLEGSSMLPLFRPGETALAGSPGDLRPGDCAVYEHGGRLLLHRVLAAGPQGALLADDAGRLEPHQVARAALRGRVLSRNPLKSGRAGALYCRLRRALYRCLHG
jgi:hypothetical protein